MRTLIPKNFRPVPAEAERVFKGVIYDVYHWQQTMFDGSSATFEMLKRPDTVEILAIKDGKVVLIDEEQPGLKRALDIPGGRHDIEAETELEGAAREMHEETGMVFKNYKLIAMTQPLTKIDYIVYLFLATGFVRQDEPHVDEGERISVQLATYDEFARTFGGSKHGKSLWKDLVLEAGSIEGLQNLPEYQ